MGNKEYKGADIFEYIGLYIRYFLCNCLRVHKDLKDLSGDINGKDVEATLLFSPFRPLMPLRGMHVHVTCARASRAAPIYQ